MDTLPNFLDRLNDISLFKLSESPVHVGVVRRAVVLLGLPANVQRLLINHVDVEKERQVVVGIRVLVVHQDALFEVLNGVLVVSDLEVGEA